MNRGREKSDAGIVVAGAAQAIQSTGVVVFRGLAVIAGAFLGRALWRRGRFSRAIAVDGGQQRVEIVAVIVIIVLIQFIDANGAAEMGLLLGLVLAAGDVDDDTGRHLRMQDDLDFFQTQGLEGTVEHHLLAGHGDAGGDDRLGDIAGGHRAI